MKMTTDQIKLKIESGEIKAITLDTNIFDQKQNGLEYGLLRQLEQFNDSITTVVFSDVVLREVESHIKEAAANSQADLRAALKSVGNAWQVSKDIRTETLNSYFGASSPEDIAKKRVCDFVERAGGEIVEVGETVNLHELMERYFAPKPPFAERKEKKNEFPDALALMSLEHWAEDNGQKILVVTKDGDWEAYCESSEWLIAISGLQEALTLFQSQTAEYVCQQLVEGIRGEDPLEFVDAIERAIYYDLESQFDFNPFADSHMGVETSWSPEVSIGEVSIQDLNGEGFYLNPIRFTQDQLIVAVAVDVQVDFSCDFNFFVYDSIDKEDVPMGSTSAETSMDLVVEVLVTLGGEMPVCDEVQDVEIMKQRVDVDFGYIDPFQHEDPTHEKY